MKFVNKDLPVMSLQILESSDRHDLQIFFNIYTFLINQKGRVVLVFTLTEYCFWVFRFSENLRSKMCASSLQTSLVM